MLLYYHRYTLLKFNFKISLQPHPFHLFKRQWRGQTFLEREAYEFEQRIIARYFENVLVLRNSLPRVLLELVY